MIDLILAGTLAATFYGGFKLGNKHKSLKDAFEVMRQSFKK